MTRTAWAALTAVAVLLAIQLVPVERTNPPLGAPLVVSADVQAILDRACYDCHSNETRWPWYSRVAPVSWLVAYDVNHAREHLNFSTWGELPADEQAENLEEAWEEVSEGKMPLWYYIPLHSEARLSDQDREVLRTWLAPDGPAPDAEAPDAEAPDPASAAPAAHDHADHPHSE